MKKTQHTYNTPLIKEDAPFAFVEAYNALRTNLQFASINSDYKKIIVTSSIPAEGKSSVAINLALSLQAANKKVLLVDADLRKPSIQRYLHLKAVGKLGLTNVLAGVEKLEKCIIHLSDSGLNLLLSGAIPPNPAEILGSEKMHKLITLLEGQYDYILFDTPPVSVVTDAAVLSKWCDGVLLVVRQKFAPRQIVLEAKNNLTKVGANIIGCVFSDFVPSHTNRSKAYYNYKYSYYYDNKTHREVRKS